MLSCAVSINALGLLTMQMQTWCNNNVRITFLTTRLVRFESSPEGVFEDRPTLAVSSRVFPPVAIKIEESGERVILATSDMRVSICKSASKLDDQSVCVEFLVDGRNERWWPGKEDTQNLGGTIRTLDKCNGEFFFESSASKDGQRVSLGNGLLSRSGWAVFDDSNSIVLDSSCAGPSWVKPRQSGERQDLYLFAYGLDFRSALADAAKLFGSQPLPPRFVFGLWWCRYWAFLDWELEQVVSKCRMLKIPLDVLSVDMDWHKQGWTGFSWEKRYFPSPDNFISRLKRQNIKLCLNLHPAEGFGPHEDLYEAALAKQERAIKGNPIEFDCSDRESMDLYFNTFLRPLEESGVDFWWLDWQQGDRSKMEGLDPLPWLNELHWRAHESACPTVRPLGFSRYGGLGSGRHPVGFSGDTYVSWDSLALQPSFTATAGNVLYGYWSHDIGGHFHGELDGELFTRWMQFGSFSPVLRVHGTKQSTNDRQFWHAEWPYCDFMIEVARRRFELIPYIYSEARTCELTGLSLCRPMYLHFPNVAESYEYPGQYFFGEHLLVAPITAPVNKDDKMAPMHVWLPEGDWFDMSTGEVLRGGRKVTRAYLCEEVPLFARLGTLLPGQVLSDFSASGSYSKLVITAIAGASGVYDLYEDDGETTNFRKEEFAILRCEQQFAANEILLSLSHKQGTFSGYLEKRTLSYRIPGVFAPERVLLNGRELPCKVEPEGACWYLDGRTGDLIVDCGEVSLSRPIEVRVRFGTTGVRLNFPLAGVARRLYRAFDAARILELEWERELGGMAQVCARIASRPQSMRQELEQLRAASCNLPRTYDDVRAQIRSQTRYVDKKLKSVDLIERIIERLRDVYLNVVS